MSDNKLNDDYHEDLTEHSTYKKEVIYIIHYYLYIFNIK